MAAIVNSIEISRRPEEVFAYLADPSHLPEWQESAVSVRQEGDAGTVGTKITVTRRVGGRERTMTSEVAEVNPPRSWAVRGVDGPVRATVNGTIEPLADGQRSRVTLSLDFEPRGIGMLLVPFVVRPQVRKEMPRNLRRLKEVLESSSGAS